MGVNIMDIDFSKYIVQQKERDTLYKPFPCGEGYALFAKTDGGEFMKILVSSKEMLESFLKELGFDWGVEKGEFLNFDSASRILKRYPALENAEDAVASQEGEGVKYVYKLAYRGRVWEVEGLKSLFDMSDHPGAVELKEVDHPPRYSVASEEVPKKKDGSPKKKAKKRETKKGEYRDENGDLKKVEKSDSHKKGRWHPHGRPGSYGELWRKVNEISEEKED
tara:strand:+ start:613 stop:1278 length:666 start_codon:yes stop_codon:yes gene_type:complete